jgi:hypothetical protein
MVVQLIQISCDLENLESFRIPVDHEWTFDLRLTSDDEVCKNVTLTTEDVQGIPNSRGSANLILSAGKNNYATITVEALPKVVNAEFGANESGKQVVVLALDCRGCEIIAWKPTGFYEAVSTAGTTFGEVDLSECEWYDVDPETNEPVSITNVVTSIVNYKK